MPRSTPPRPGDTASMPVLVNRASPSASAKTPAERAERLWSAGVVVSVVCHLAAIGVVGAVIHESLTGKTPRPALDTQWTAALDDAPEMLERLDRSDAESLADSPVEFIADIPAFESSRSTDVGIPLPAAELPSDSFLDDRAGAELLAAVPATTGIGGDAGSAGGGEDGGGGGGGPGSFFGIQAEGTRFVYVLDRSGSMNTRHKGPGNTRLGRVKLEIAGSIGTLTPEQQFYIVLFDQNVLAMPASQMQPAVPDVQNHYLQWMAKIRANGETDPRAALAVALALQPDAIFFLTDGDFSATIKRDLLTISQPGAAIHTIALGSRRGHAVLKSLAENNAGTFTYVP